MRAEGRQRSARKQAHIDDVGAYESGADATQRATAEALGRVSATTPAVVLVEGISDQIAVETLANQMGRDLRVQGVVVLPIGGAHGVATVVKRFAGQSELTVLGLCDRNEFSLFERAFDADPDRSVDDVFVCDPDLEHELIGSVTPAELEAVLADHDDLGRFRKLQAQAAWIDRPFEQQMHRWLRAHARRPARYARIIIDHSGSGSAPAVLSRLVNESPPPDVWSVDHVAAVRLGSDPSVTGVHG